MDWYRMVSWLPVDAHATVRVPGLRSGPCLVCSVVWCLHICTFNDTDTLCMSMTRTAALARRTWHGAFAVQPAHATPVVK